VLVLFQVSTLDAQNSVARDWNDEILEAVRNDFARPTVHARNLFHTSVIMYDVWAIFNENAETVFLGKTFGGYTCSFDGIVTPTNIDEAIHEITSYAVYRLLTHRFMNSPNAANTLENLTSLFESYGYDVNISSTDYSSNSYSALGNYIAQEMIAFGLQDGSNEENNYENSFYTPENEPLILDLYEDNSDINPNKWQPLAFDVFIDQSGNIYALETPEFLSPEWGKVTPFSLKPEDLTILNNSFDSYVYNDPGFPEFIQNSTTDGIEDPYKWNFALVIAWSAHLDPADDTLIDISPASLGNTAMTTFPTTFEEYQSFYNFTDGGSIGSGHEVNPFTGSAYSPQMVKRSNYTRVLAEFWADGPDSETPPGHWFTILNYVSDHPETVKKFGGRGPVVSDLEWDVKSYLVLGGAMHDSAINIWGIKGYYDYIRPISAIRYMASKGQSTDPGLPNFNSHGLPLIPGLIELIETGDPLANSNGDLNVGKIKVKSWKGPDFISNPATDVAGVDWILGTHWWPYQRPTFVTPPFAGYLSGHSTFSRAAAETLTQITGSEFFPGGMGTFEVLKNNFLVFEQGPSDGFTLQWATYQDASDQTSLSRIWGGIHPPIDDIKGRIIGDKIGKETFTLAKQYFSGTLSLQDISIDKNTSVYPNPVENTLYINTQYLEGIKLQIYSLTGKLIFSTKRKNHQGELDLKLDHLAQGIYILKGVSSNNSLLFQRKIIK